MDQGHNPEHEQAGKTTNSRFPRAHSRVVPPDPIPNSVVKRASADGTRTAGSRESRTVRGVYFLHKLERGRDAGVAQLVEHNLAKVGVESSSLFSRSRKQ